jgi:catechol 2,3-dioxygenase-like lactoylglutathione lyase family enzyme
MDARISLVTLGVRNLERSIAFYRDGLRWPLSSASSGDVAFFRTGGTVLALFPYDELAADANLPADGSGFGGIALAHNVARKELVDAVLAEALAAGATILKPASDTSWGGYSGYFADPDGYPWEVAHNPFFPFAADGSLQLPE